MYKVLLFKSGRHLCKGLLSVVNTPYHCFEAVSTGEQLSIRQSRVQVRGKYLQTNAWKIKNATGRHTSVG